MTHRLAQDAQGRPVLWTEGLRLCRHADHDIEPAARFRASERSHRMDGAWSPEKAREGHLDLIDQWRKRHRFSLFTIALHDGDEGIGGTGPFYPDGHPEPELGRSLWNAAGEGKGYARSIRIAERLGATRDPNAETPIDEPIVVCRHRRGGHA